MAETLAERMAAAKARAKGATARHRPAPYNLNAEGDDPVKLMLFGHLASGKTYFIIGLLLSGERVYVLSSDFGGNGLLTVKNALKSIGRLDLLKNIRGLDVSTYDDVIDFLENPVAFDAEIEKFDPTAFMWEGFSSFNIDILDEYILSMAPGANNAGDLRHAGFTHTQQDWQGMKRGTLRALRKALAFSLPSGKRIHKIVTAHQSKPTNNELTNQTERGPLIQSSARDLAGGGFDVILQCYKEEEKETKEVKHFYRCTGASDKFSVKNRGFQLKAVMEADPEKVWKILTNREEK